MLLFGPYERRILLKHRSLQRTLYFILRIVIKTIARSFFVSNDHNSARIFTTAGIKHGVVRADQELGEVLFHVARTIPCFLLSKSAFPLAQKPKSDDETQNYL